MTLQNTLCVLPSFDLLLTSFISRSAAEQVQIFLLGQTPNCETQMWFKTQIEKS